MPVNNVGQNVLDAVYARLTNQTYGYNSAIQSQAPSYSLAPNELTIDFSTASQQFIFGQIDPDSLEESSPFKYPLGMLYILETGQTGTQKFNQFSGVVRCIFEVHVSHTKITHKYNYEAHMSCVEDAVVSVLNRVENQDWSDYPMVVYNGGITSKRGPIKQAGDNWRQRIGFSMMFENHE